jgi:glycosyltransferase involved in cell wall biosynthesis
MKVLFLTLTRIDSLDKRGIYHDLLRQFVLNNFEVVVVCPVERRDSKSTNVILLNGVKILQVKTLNIQKTPTFEKAISLLTIDYFFKRAIIKHLNNHNFDLILYSTPPITITNLIMWLKKKYSSLTYLLLKDIFPQNAVDLKMIRSNSLIHKYFKRQERILYEISDKIGCMSPANKKFILNQYPGLINKVEINPNSIEVLHKKTDNQMREYIFNKFNIPLDSTLFIYGGNLGKPQGPILLSQIIKDCQLKCPKAYFLIIGNGTEYTKLKAWFDRHKPYNANLINTLIESEYDKIVSCSDVGLILLRSEFTVPNFPSRILTYLEYKKPILSITDLATDIGSISENAGFGIWAKYGDLESILKKIQFFESNVTKRIEMGEAGHSFFIKNYDVKITFNKISKFINQ